MDTVSSRVLILAKGNKTVQSIPADLSVVVREVLSFRLLILAEKESVVAVAML